MSVEIRTSTMLLLVIVCTGCTTISAGYDFNPAVDFDDYKTFSWVTRHPLVAAPPDSSPLLEDRLEQTTRELLTAKGYRFVDAVENADFVIGFGVGVQDEVRIDSYPTRYRGAWHWPGATASTLRVRQFVEGRLTVDIFDVATDQPAWHGTATKTITSADRENAQRAIREALTAILANFPPR